MSGSLVPGNRWFPRHHSGSTDPLVMGEWVETASPSPTTPKFPFSDLPPFQCTHAPPPPRQTQIPQPECAASTAIAVMNQLNSPRAVCDTLTVLWTVVLWKGTGVLGKMGCWGGSSPFPAPTPSSKSGPRAVHHICPRHSSVRFCAALDASVALFAVLSL